MDKLFGNHKVEDKQLLDEIVLEEKLGEAVSMVVGSEDEKAKSD